MLSALFIFKQYYTINCELRLTILNQTKGHKALIALEVLTFKIARLFKTNYCIS